MNTPELNAAVDALASSVASITAQEKPIDTVAAALNARHASDAVLAAAVDAARASGVTWQGIGDVLGTSRQAAFQRFGHPIDPRTGAPMNTTPLPDASGRASDLFARITAGQWDIVVAEFDDTMKAQITAEVLAEGWAQAAAMVGAFEKQGEPFARAMDALTVVDIPLAFEAGDMVGRVAYDAAGLIAGLFILTPSAAAGL